MKILIVLTGGIGNAIMFTPALEKLIKNYPPEKNTYFLLTSELGAKTVFEPSGYFKHFFVYNHASLFSFIKTFFKILFLNKFDLFISSMGLNNLKAGMLALASKARIRCGENDSSFLFTHKIKADYNEHETIRNLNIIKPLIKNYNASIKLKFYFNERHTSEIQKLISDLKINTTKKIIGIHLGSNDFLAAKRWNINNFKKLIIEIQNAYPETQIIIFGGKNEIEYSKQIQTTDKIINVVGKTSLSAAGLLMKYCSAFITNDSGLMHLAAAADIPVIALFGPTIINKNRPFSEKAVVITKNLDCSPCYQYNRQINCNKNFECMNLINSKEVFNTLKKYLK